MSLISFNMAIGYGPNFLVLQLLLFIPQARKSRLKITQRKQLLHSNQEQPLLLHQLKKMNHHQTKAPQLQHQALSQLLLQLSN
jgi:hypothetical protein